MPGYGHRREAAAKGAPVILAVRDVARGTQIAREFGDAEVLELGLAELGGVRAAAARAGDVDVLVNNAGTSPPRRIETIDGFEMHLAVNFLGPFLFTGLVLPRVRKRVVILGSMIHKRAKIHFDDPDFRTRKWTRSAAYGQSKLADMLWGAKLSRRLEKKGRGVDVQLAHPGWADTNLGSPVENPVFKRLLSPFVSRVAQPADRAALPALYAATQDLQPGGYVGPDGLGEIRGHPKPVGRSKASEDPELARRLWEHAEADGRGLVGEGRSVVQEVAGGSLVAALCILSARDSQVGRRCDDDRGMDFVYDASQVHFRARQP
ncbi:SDR family NAD(P)-dependent oxidoreductase [Actinocorallia sp. B10E7]|uniref:SDR family NAD(P)-dependent oxidoreductase n=1 Tax=Actinocorallia sp. B10E7 TaxID=3153558 RepID=UPI00325E1D00